MNRSNGKFSSYGKKITQINYQQCNPQYDDVISLLSCGQNFLSKQDFDLSTLFLQNLPSQENLNNNREKTIDYMFKRKCFNSKIKNDIMDTIENKLYSTSLYFNDFYLEYETDLVFKYLFPNCMCIKDNVLAFILNQSTLVLTKILSHSFTEFRQIPLPNVQLNTASYLQFHKSKSNTLLIISRSSIYEISFSQDLSLIGNPVLIPENQRMELFDLDSCNENKIDVISLYPFDFQITNSKTGMLFHPEYCSLGEHSIFFTENCFGYLENNYKETKYLSIYDFQDRFPCRKSFYIPFSAASIYFNYNDNCFYALSPRKDSKLSIIIMPSNDYFPRKVFGFNDPNIKVGSYVTTSIQKPESGFIDIKNLPFNLFDHAIYIYPQNVNFEDAKNKLTEMANSNQLKEANFIFINNLDFFNQDKQFFAEYFNKNILQKHDKYTFQYYLSSQLLHSDCLLDIDISKYLTSYLSQRSYELICMKADALTITSLQLFKENDKSLLTNDNVFDKSFIPFLSSIIDIFKQHQNIPIYIKIMEYICNCIDILSSYPLFIIKIEKIFFELVQAITKPKAALQTTKELSQKIMDTFSTLLYSFIQNTKDSQLFSLKHAWFLLVFNASSLSNPIDIKNNFCPENLDLTVFETNNSKTMDQNIIEFIKNDKSSIMETIYKSYKPALNKHLTDTLKQNDRIYLICFASFAHVLPELFNIKDTLKSASQTLLECFNEMMNIRNYLRQYEKGIKQLGTTTTETDSNLNQQIIITRKCLFLLQFSKTIEIPPRFISKFLKDSTINIEEMYDKSALLSSFLGNSILGMQLVSNILNNNFFQYYNNKKIEDYLPMNNEMVDRIKSYLTIALNAYILTKDSKALYYLFEFVKNLTVSDILSFIFNYLSTIQTQDKETISCLFILQYIILNKCDSKQLNIDIKKLTENLFSNSSNQIILLKVLDSIDFNDFSIFTTLFESFRSQKQNITRLIQEIIIIYIKKQTNEATLDIIFKYIKSMILTIGNFISKNELTAANKYIHFIRKLLQLEKEDFKIAKQLKSFLSEVPTTTNLTEKEELQFLGKLSIISIDIFPFLPQDPYCQESIITLQQSGYNAKIDSNIKNYHKFVYIDKYAFPIPFDISVDPKFEICNYLTNKKHLEDNVFYIESEIILPPMQEFSALVEYAIMNPKDNLIYENIIIQSYCKYIELPSFLSSFALEDFANYSLQYSSINELFSLPHTLNKIARFKHFPKEEHANDNMYMFKIQNEGPLNYLSHPLNFNLNDIQLVLKNQTQLSAELYCTFEFYLCLFYSDLRYSHVAHITVEKIPTSNPEHTIKIHVDFAKKVFSVTSATKTNRNYFVFPDDLPAKDDIGLNNYSYHILFTSSLPCKTVTIQTDISNAFLSDQILPTYKLHNYLSSDTKFTFDQLLSYISDTYRSETGSYGFSSSFATTNDYLTSTSFGFQNPFNRYSLQEQLGIPPKTSTDKQSKPNINQTTNKSQDYAIIEQIHSQIDKYKKKVQYNGYYSNQISLDNIVWCDDSLIEYLQQSLIRKTTLQWVTLSILKTIIRFKDTFSKVFDHKTLLELYRIINYSLNPYFTFQYNNNNSYQVLQFSFLNIETILENAKELILNALNHSHILDLMRLMSNNYLFHLCSYQKSPILHLNNIKNFNITGQKMDYNTLDLLNSYEVHKYPLDSPFELVSMMLDVSNLSSLKHMKNITLNKIIQSVLESYIKISVLQSPALQYHILSHQADVAISLFEGRHLLYSRDQEISTTTINNLRYSNLHTMLKSLEQSYNFSSSKIWSKPVKVANMSFNLKDSIIRSIFDDLLLIAFSIGENRVNEDIPIDQIPLSIFTDLWYEANAQAGTPIQTLDKPKTGPVINKVNAFTYHITNPNQLKYNITISTKNPKDNEKVIVTSDKTFRSHQDLLFKPFISVSEIKITTSSVDYFISLKFCSEKDNIKLNLETCRQDPVSHTIDLSGDYMQQFRNDCLDYVNKWTKEDSLYLVNNLPNSLLKLGNWKPIFEWLKSTPLYNKPNVSNVSVIMRVFVFYFLNCYINLDHNINSFYFIQQLRPTYFTPDASLYILQTYISRYHHNNKPHLTINRRIDLDKFENSIVYQVTNKLMSYGFLLKFGKVWRISYSNEAGFDAQGLGRDCLSETFKSFFNLKSQVVIKTPSMRRNPKLEFYLPIPDESIVKRNCNTSFIYKGIGALIAGIILSGYQQYIPFPPIVWKLLCLAINVTDINNEDLVTIKDIQEVDEMFCSNLENQENDRLIPWKCVDWYGNECILPGHLNNEFFLISNQNMKELYIKECVSFRLNQLMKNITLMANGFKANSYSLKFHWYNLSSIVQGVPLDFNQINSVLCFREGTKQAMTRLINVLKTFTNEELKMFLKFTTGLERIPHGTTSFKIYVYFMELSDMLPVSHTCNCQIDIPSYPTEEIMKSKILIAITTCGTMEIN